MSSNLIRMAITPVTEGRYQAEVVLENGITATSKPFPTTDGAAHWASLFSEEGDKPADQDYSPEVKAGLHSVGKVPTEDTEATE